MKSTVRVPPARGRTWPWRVVRGLWTLPTTLLGHLVGWLVSGRAPTYVRGPAAEGWLYPLLRAPQLSWFGAVTIGHAIIYRPGLFDGWSGRLILAHELAHTRQHDRLGPFYLPAHILAQTVSALLSLAGGPPRTSRVHDRNPLEERWICLGVSACHELGGRSPHEHHGHPQGRLAASLLAALGA